MLRLTPLVIGAALNLATHAPSQVLQLYGTNASYTSRGSLGTGSGELLMGLHSTHWRGIGDAGSTCDVDGFRVIVQDQNSCTQERFRYVVRRGTDSRGPATGTSGLLFRSNEQFVLTHHGCGPIQWLTSTTFATPITVPCDDFFAWGIEMTNSPNRPQDGLSVLHANSAGPRATDWSHPNGGDHAWEIAGNARLATHPSDRRSWFLSMIIKANLLRIGTEDPASPGRYQYGLSGLWPLPGRALAVSIRSHQAPSTRNVPVVLGIGSASPPIQLFPGVGRLWVSPSSLVIPIGMSSSSGDLFDRTLTRSAPLGRFPPIFVQAVYLSAGGNVTNAQAVEILP